MLSHQFQDYNLDIPMTKMQRGSSESEWLSDTDPLSPLEAEEEEET